MDDELKKAYYKLTELVQSSGATALVMISSGELNERGNKSAVAFLYGGKSNVEDLIKAGALHNEEIRATIINASSAIKMKLHFQDILDGKFMSFEEFSNEYLNKPDVSKT